MGAVTPPSMVMVTAVAELTGKRKKKQIAARRRRRRDMDRSSRVPDKRKGESFEPVTMGHIRGNGVTRLVYCESLWCNHSGTLEADFLPDDTVLRPDWSQQSHEVGPGCLRGK